MTIRRGNKPMDIEKYALSYKSWPVLDEIASYLQNMASFCGTIKTKGYKTLLSSKLFLTNLIQLLISLLPTIRTDFVFTGQSKQIMQLDV